MAESAPINSEFEFDCPKSFEFKDPNVVDFNIDKKISSDKQKENKLIPKVSNKPIAKKWNRNHMKVYSEKKAVSPSSKKRQFNPISLKKVKPNTYERLYAAAQRRKPTYKTLAELVLDFDKNTRVYEDKNSKNLNAQKKIVIPKSPKLLSVNRNRPRTVLGQLDKDDINARSQMKNIIKAEPINKRLFKNYVTGIPKVQVPKKTFLNTMEFGFGTDKRLEMRKEKMKAIQESIENVNFVFKAKPMPVFRKVPVMMRNGKIKKQLSEQQILKPDEKVLIKQISDSTLIVNKQKNLENEKPANQLLNESINNIESKFKSEEEKSICEYKSLTNIDLNNSINTDDEKIDEEIKNIVETLKFSSLEQNSIENNGLSFDV